MQQGQCFPLEHEETQQGQYFLQPAKIEVLHQQRIIENTRDASDVFYKPIPFVFLVVLVATKVLLQSAHLGVESIEFGFKEIVNRGIDR